MAEDIAIIFVIYNPKEDDINNIKRFAALYNVVVIDNSDNEHTFSKEDNIIYKANHKNLGIATAQNIGIETVKEGNKATYIIFLDQDTRLEDDYPRNIRDEFIRIQQQHSNLALLGPTVMKIADGEEYKSIFHKEKTDDFGFSEKREIISSGSCTSINALEKIGNNDDRLFIDFVDFEWCWRAKEKGFICGITKRIEIQHQVGIYELSIGSYKVIVSAPYRYYYQYRNFLWLSKRGYAPLQWKVATAVKYVARLVYFPFVVKKGKECWKYMIKGIKDGLK